MSERLKFERLVPISNDSRPWLASINFPTCILLGLHSSIPIWGFLEGFLQGNYIFDNWNWSFFGKGNSFVENYLFSLRQRVQTTNWHFSKFRHFNTL